MISFEARCQMHSHIQGNSDFAWPRFARSERSVKIYRLHRLWYPNPSRIKQAKLATLAFGVRAEVWYPPTREGFKAYWQHARVYMRLKYENPSTRRGVRVIATPVLMAWSRDLTYIRRSPKAALPWPDRMTNLDYEFYVRTFRYRMIYDVLFDRATRPRPKFETAHALCVRFGLSPSPFNAVGR